VSVQIDTIVPHDFSPCLTGYGLDLKTAYEALPRPLAVVPPITHCQKHIAEAFETSSNTAAAWLQEQLKD
jgi:hypothetical protein